ncbi:MAG: hypothetical protein ACKV2Q_21055 [Planctomycetaceae bacterium]
MAQNRRFICVSLTDFGGECSIAVHRLFLCQTAFHWWQKFSNDFIDQRHDLVGAALSQTTFEDGTVTFATPTKTRTNSVRESDKKSCSAPLLDCQNVAQRRVEACVVTGRGTDRKSVMAPMSEKLRREVLHSQFSQDFGEANHGVAALAE